MISKRMREQQGVSCIILKNDCIKHCAVTRILFFFVKIYLLEGDIDEQEVW